jgi:hypothetical protein
MSAATIRSKVKNLLAKAVIKTGSSNSDKVYLVNKTFTAGTPLAPSVPTTSNIELLNAVFTNYDARYGDINILAGDRKLVCDNTVTIKQGDTVTQGDVSYKTIAVGIIAPTSDILLYKLQMRVL